MNGELFATVTTRQGGRRSSPAPTASRSPRRSWQALEELFDVFIYGFDFFEDLLDPLG